MTREPVRPATTDPGAIRTFCLRYFRAKLRSHEQSDAEDLASEAWILADRALRRYAERKKAVQSVAGLLATICHRLFVSYIRGKTRTASFIDRDVDLASTDQGATRAERRALSLHPHQHRRALLMLVFEWVGTECRDLFALLLEGWKTEAIATELGITRAATRKRISRCYATVRALIGDDPETFFELALTGAT